MNDPRNILIIILFGIIVFMIAAPRLQGQDRGAVEVPSKERTPPADACVVSNCHGLDIQCAPEGPQACTMMYGFGDRCRVHAQCGIVDGVCAPIETEAFRKCVACVRACETTDPDKMPDAFLCESQCS